MSPSRFPRWSLGLVIICLLIAVPFTYFLRSGQPDHVNPAAGIPLRATHVSHSDIVKGPFKKPQDVTRECLTCHKGAAKQVMKTSHWKWESKPFDIPWRSEKVSIGKINQINNFCIGTQGNENKCMSCHIGYGWEDGREAALSNPENVDCLACHADTGTYGKGAFGNPGKDVDLLEAARSVRTPTRENCGKCHFDGGGGNGVKHGDLDESLYFPRHSLDVHMGGKNNMLCIDCHVTNEHQIKGRLVADNFTIEPDEQVSCVQCHKGKVHEDERITTHLSAVACQTCHIPTIAREEPTKVTWDWSKAGDGNREEDHYEYLKIKGEFTYNKNFAPTYLWFNGNNAYRYLLGDEIDKKGLTYINKPDGSIGDPKAKIFPFKAHTAKQPYDKVYNYLLQPITSGEGGYWKDWSWDKAFELSTPITGLKYSGQYGFTKTVMYWATTHMVEKTDSALQCADCHDSAANQSTNSTRLDWAALGYPGDPILWGGRKLP
ncbi:MAG: tetrathionate reductase family octaheme c-type cytochrome [Rhodospirillaceae bacterium]|jgi:octaheme c-type cytochrome (tetrathionate reductase family)|nr:tetrathionate reductase family octaheme c-type cytochrome [Rhodospirillaceae bacterium]MBT5244405.1 tetrathionate reductase family octaheme c-type cytochrome [Rhodospirillaceae bacterium]MBT5562285.1 tetrathionate reductase family octaheme c-type cytochrome [Rhodospirillaceae bacterium]MBT6240714.1 tetrathionate reductase family octaheme c-type cytochrome [Rhodospirillaceae bacterium]